MRFPDRPVVTAGLGIAFALVILVALSSPAFFQGSASPVDNVVVLTTSQATSATSATTPLSPSPNASSSLQSVPASSSAVNSQIASISSPTVLYGATTVITAAATTVQQTTPTINAGPAYSFGSNSEAPSALYLSANRFTVIGVIALVLALAAALIMYRKVNSGD
ncbi:MAG: hypothetical protein ACYC7D_06560 [Nitrososphaerales archaeon]